MQDKRRVTYILGKLGLCCLLFTLTAFQFAAVINGRGQSSSYSSSYTPERDWGGQTVESALAKAVHTHVKPGTTCDHTGYTYDSGSNTYTFHGLTVAAYPSGSSNYYIMDASVSNCIVYLRGTQDGVGAQDAGFNSFSSPTVGTTPSPSYLTKLEFNMAFLAGEIPMNVWRLVLNATWWNNNDLVQDPKMGIMHYRDWINRLVTFIEKHGMYVEFDQGPIFSDPPCGDSGTATITPITFCAMLNAGSQEWQESEGTVGVAQSGDPDCPNTPNLTPCDSNGVQEDADGHYITPINDMWDSVAQTYSNDPAIIYDDWNETHNFMDNQNCTPGLGGQSCCQQWQANQNTLINTVQSHNTTTVHHLVMTYFTDNNDGDNGGCQLTYSQSDLVYDEHIYPPGNILTNTVSDDSDDGSSPWTKLDDIIADANSGQHAIVVNEWGDNGGCEKNGSQGDTTSYCALLNNTAMSDNFGLVYFAEGYLHNGTSLSQTGTNVQTCYGDAYTSPQGTCNPTM